MRVNNFVNISSIKAYISNKQKDKRFNALCNKSITYR